MSVTIPIKNLAWDESRLVTNTPSPYVHIAIGDVITPEWELQRKTALRFHSSEELNFFHLQEKYRHSMRLDLLKSILSRIPTDQVIIMIDAFDVLFNAPLFSVYSLFLDVERMTPPDQYGRRTTILFNGEKNCWPDRSTAQRYPRTDLASPNPFLNAGIMVGRSGAILEILTRRGITKNPEELDFWSRVIDNTERSDDQYFWTHSYLRSLIQQDLPRIEIDHFCRLACCMFGREPDALIASHGGVIVKESGARPCLIHFNGPTKAGMNGVARQLGYQI